MRSHDLPQAEDGNVAAYVEEDDGGRSAADGNGAMGAREKGESNDFV